MLVEISVLKARELYNLDNSLRDSLLVNFTDRELGIFPELKDWEELTVQKGDMYLSPRGEIIECTGFIGNEVDPNIFADTPTIKSAIAFGKLSLLKKELKEECEVDWTSGKVKYTIVRSGNTPKPDIATFYYRYLAFNTKEVRDAFLNKHKDIIDDYLMIPNVASV